MIIQFNHKYFMPHFMTHVFDPLGIWKQGMKRFREIIYEGINN